MLVTIFSSLMITKRRNLIQVFPKRMRKLFDIWEIRVAVLLSLTLQCIQILLGSRRKFSTSMKLRIILWLAYLSSDAVATVSLSILSSNAGEYEDDSIDSNFVVMAFWAPFLLLHLGGPDTITAYSLEDNELWLRHLLALVVQVLVAVYVILRAWVSVTLNFLAIPLLVAGTIKYGERIWTLWKSSRIHFRDSLFPHPDAGPNYARYMEEYESKKEEGFDVTLGKLIVDPMQGDTNFYPAEKKINLTEADIHYANNFFSMFKPLFADLILGFHDIQNSQSFFRNRSYSEALKVVEVELGFMYDLTYTKAVVVYSQMGVFLRTIEFLSTISLLCVFGWVRKESYPTADVIITYVLLVGAIIIEIHSVIILLFSDWAMLWLEKHKNNVAVDLLHPAISLAIPLARKRWSDTMRQYNLIRFCLKDRPPKFCTVHKIKFISLFLEKYRYKDTDNVSDALKELIFEELQRRLTSNSSDVNACKQLVSRRGDWVLEQAQCLDNLEWSITKVEFDRSILLWHIATQLCYYCDRNKKSRPVQGLNCMSSRLLSRYMLYLLLMCPFMLPNGIGQIRFPDTCAEATEFFNARKYKDEKEACSLLLGVSTDISPSDVKGHICKSVLFDACRLAKELNKLETNAGWDGWKKWDLITHVWVEMLCYAASHCQWIDHAQQLGRGGELLTHVWLLMAHFGITEQVQEGHSRARLVIK